MALIPSEPVFGQETPKGERDLYHLAAASSFFNGERSYLFHSLSLTESGRQVRGETDFVYLDDEFLLFLEVKGGVIHFRADTREWGVMGGTKIQDPFRQVANNLFFTRDKVLKAKFGPALVDKLIIGYGVMFPESGRPRDFQDDEAGTISYDTRLIYTSDDRDMPDSFAAYIRRLQEYWRAHNRYRQHAGRITQEQKTAVRNFFARDLIFRPPLPGLLRQDAAETTMFTREQRWVLSATEAVRDKAGVIVTGGAGTGKTVLALWLAERCTSRGERTLLLCYNKNLAVWLRHQAMQQQPAGNELLTICNIHALYSTYMKPAGAGSEYFNEQFPAEFARIYPGLGMAPYDRVIIDEAQDIFRESHFKNIDLLLKGGLKSSCWHLFMDHENQDIYRGFNAAYYERFLKQYDPIVLPLDKNCRNTPKVVRGTGLYTGIRSQETAKTVPGMTEEHFYASEKDLINQLILRVRNLTAEKVSPADVIILASTRELADRLPVSSPGVFCPLTEASLINPDPRRVRVTTPGAFKGLESPIVILAGIETLPVNDHYRNTELYLAATRASYGFIAYFQVGLKEALLSRKQHHFMLDPSL